MEINIEIGKTIFPIYKDPIILLFDIDKTLVGWDKEKHISIRVKTLDEFSRLFPLDGAAYNSIKDCSKSMWECVKPYLNPDEETRKKLYEIYFRIEKEQLDENSPSLFVYEGVEETLQKLKDEGYQLGILSNGKSEVQRKKLVLSNLDKYFDKDKIIISEEIGSEKPNDVCYKTVLYSLGVDKEPYRVVLIDDKRENVENAVKNGMWGILALWASTVEYINNRIFAVSNPKDILTTIKNMKDEEKHLFIDKVFKISKHPDIHAR